jgi:hypothetical protein
MELHSEFGVSVADEGRRSAVASVPPHRDRRFEA